MRFILFTFAVTSWAISAQATMIPRISLERLVNESDNIVTGKVLRSWTAWDPAHQYIWTHNEVQVSSVTKGVAGSTLVVSEPSGTLDGRMLRVEGAVHYTPGEQVLLFVANTPLGYKRAVGWGQGKYMVTPDNRIHATAAAAEFVDRRASATGTSLRILDGASLTDVKARVSGIAQRKVSAQ